MAEYINLDGQNQTTFTIPFTGDDENDGGTETPFPRPLHYEYDLPEGEKLRIDAYTAAWRKCLDRIKSIVRALHAPIASEVEHAIYTSYDRALPGLPYPEIPVIGITDPTSSSTFLDQIAVLTDSFDLEDTSNITAFTSHLYPNDCNNVMSAMKALISGFVNRPHILDKGKGRSGISLANYDIEILSAWYTAICNTYDLTEQRQPKLIVLLHDFEQLDPLVIQDIFSISSLYISRLPLIFTLALSSPASPSYLHSTYPRSTLALLRFSNYTVPSGAKVLEEILLQTFFDSSFEPDIIIGPGVLTYLADYYNRHNSSVDAALNILQLAHLKHFSGEALTLIVRSTPAPEALSQDTSLPFIEELLSRLQSFETSSNANDRNWTKQSISSLIAATDNARTDMYSRARRLRIGFGIVKLIQDFMTSQGYKGLDWDNPIKGIGNIDVMISALRGGLGSDVKFLGTMVKKLKTSQLGTLLDSMHAFFNSLPLVVRSSEEEARMNLVVAINALPPRGDDDVTGASSQIAANFADWLVKYLNGLLTPLENVPLWDIWYTGASLFPSSLINPSVRATVVAGLLHPHDFTDRKKDEARADPALWELPDTSILFHRYLDSGKMLNIYDWFMAFQQELETQRKNLKERASGAKSRQSSPRKRGGKGKTKEKENAESEEDLERWQLEVQARFVRALQDLDYLGFLKHTGRKADHVQRVVFDMHD
ncbi:hypothetical protein C0995_012392 [Termitomyces sp. Mi166|nr:hypothetical protein C0995_012392 [Termitomyces sp. Mi166\